MLLCMLQKTAIGQHVNIIKYLIKLLVFIIFSSIAILFVFVIVILNVQSTYYY